MISRRFLPSMQSLQAFDAVVRSGSFTAAAQELALTQSAVSRQVAALESQLGQVLLLRGKGSVAPTPEGQAYAKAAHSALQQLQQAALALRGAQDTGRLTLAILPTFGTRWLIPRIPRFLRMHPEITLHFTTRIGQFDLLAEGVDAAVHAGQPDWPGARALQLFEDRVQPMAAPALGMAAEPAGGTTPAQIARLPRLALATRPQEWDGWMVAYDLPPAPAPDMVFEHLATLAQACVAGLGVALLPPFLFRGELATGDLVALGPEWGNGSGYWLMTPEHGRQGDAVRAFRDWLMTEITRDDGFFA
ncbi:LysR family transcriptional regulator [Roseinatronobacter alkalisoli]|uniref:LysR family transcriptional regulator n=1 Tax=Roseinatronobacter alkalisoli TaxID=3028235 RepID=A0ABT5T3B9_9RHOB|nr:LysR family transcriptional regulator [Roseinatronobacter sp. HJB301]MDD7969610.1 LysR family transcriptional regulator [Roseinatronobacter sp. HJB301]